MAVRPLRLEELAEVLAFDFNEAPGGIPTLNADWRREDQEQAVLSTCSSLITIVQDRYLRQVVQFSHFSVKEFLTSDRLAIAAEDISFYHIALEPAHTILAQACLGVLLRLDDTALMQQFPLAEYVLEHWVDHALFENVSSHIKNGIEDLFDAEKPHFSQWIRVRGNMDGDYLWRDSDTQHEVAPIYFAALCGFPDALEKLIRGHPEHINTGGGSLGAALHAASRMNHHKVVQSLLRHGADVNAPGECGRTPLMFASGWGCLEVVRWLLEHGADVNAKDEVGDWTSLLLATSAGYSEVVQTLLKHSADTNARKNSGWAPLHMASYHGRVDIVRLLLHHGADPNARDTVHRTSLYMASAEGHLDIVRSLLEHGAEIGAETRSGITSYRIALSNGHNEVVRLLLAHGAACGL